MKEAREKGLQKRRERSSAKKQIMETARQIEERKIYEELRQKYGGDPPLVKPPVVKEPPKEIPKEPPKEPPKGNYQIDYDRIIRGTAGMMSEFEKRIREDEQRKRDEITKKYEMEQEIRRRSHQEAYGMLTGKKKTNRTFQMSSALAQRQKSKYNKNNWY